jgi:hypothetical protein
LFCGETVVNLQRSEVGCATYDELWLESNLLEDANLLNNPIDMLLTQCPSHLKVNFSKTVLPSMTWKTKKATRVVGGSIEAN